jgi:hypothetical protein
MCEILVGSERPLARRVRLLLVLLGALLSSAPGRAADGRGVEVEERDVETYARPAPPPMHPAADSPVWSGPRVSLLWFDPRESLPGGFETVRKEVARIFRDIGVDVRWTVGGLGTVYGAADVPEVPVILLPDEPAPSPDGQRIMGLVMKKQEPGRAVWVFLKSVRWTLGHDLHQRTPRSDGDGKGEGHELALAVARVVAHEVVHAIAPDEPHARGGLMSHSLNRGTLLGQRIRIDARGAAAFLTRLAALLPPASEAAAAALRSVPVPSP